MLELNIVCLHNDPVPSNTYVVWTGNAPEQCLVIDPGTEDCAELLAMLRQRELVPRYVILTHAHFDHVWGTPRLKSLYPDAEIVCTEECRALLAQPRDYFIRLYKDGCDDVFSVPQIDVAVDRDTVFDWCGTRIELLLTPGHSSDSMCVKIGNRLFTGDTLLNQQKIVVNKRTGGSHEQLRGSVERIRQMASEEEIEFYPGHGESPFTWSDYIFR